MSGNTRMVNNAKSKKLTDWPILYVNISLPNHNLPVNLTLFFPIFPFDPPENIRKHWEENG